MVEEIGMEDMEAINSSFRINEECDFYKAMLINVADINDQYGQMIFYLEPFSRFQWKCIYQTQEVPIFDRIWINLQ